MFCYQCQETSRNQGCTVRGVCGKSPELCHLMDLSIYAMKGLAFVSSKLLEHNIYHREDALIIMQGLFRTITNTNWDEEQIKLSIANIIKLRDKRKAELDTVAKDRNIKYPDAVLFHLSLEEYESFGTQVGVLSTENEDIRSLRETIIYGLKGISAYGDHSAMLGYYDDDLNQFIYKALAATIDDSLSPEQLTNLVIKTGEYTVKVMELLDRANTETYGIPEPTKVNLGVGNRPGILVSGHDLKDLVELLEQSEGTGIDIYTHGEMLPANYYPAFKKYSHLHGNYGSSWWHQLDEFEKFNGPILMTTNCLVPLRKENTYLNRLYTTGMTAYPGATHIPDREPGKAKDFSAIIAQAKKCLPPTEIEKGTIMGGFNYRTVLSMADKIIEAVKSGAIKRFVVMAGCDGRMPNRQYYTEVAKKLPSDAVILTAGCAKYRYIKLNLGEIDGIPRVLDAGQCNDSYSLAVIALKLKEAFSLEDINQLPIAFDIAWYEQKAVAVLLALLSLGFKNIRLGPTLPAFLSPNVAKVITDTFGLQPITNPDDDVKAIMS
ncbi:hydroxylamine reductase [Candidatus Syntrophosphaera thermopropionivorans]|uniref:Hydroxylamine reductase n=1 Tax=Candidatus Syntrophosphaera thermopropionivorans TaxID=2593015 RepID=A0AC61QIU0_9BACT|nr:hydroxylamine reductase [Candidatus Syntrophosphaera thermopropionivorans]TDF72891.1 hydroxylamine reductase [Candidatus Syntrophosphaera thermopropionivorans]